MIRALLFHHSAILSFEIKSMIYLTLMLCGINIFLSPRIMLLEHVEVYMFPFHSTKPPFSVLRNLISWIAFCWMIQQKMLSVDTLFDHHMIDLLNKLGKYIRQRFPDSFFGVKVGKRTSEAGESGNEACTRLLFIGFYNHHGVHSSFSSSHRVKGKHKNSNSVLSTR